jgi:hypothetical protein
MCSYIDSWWFFFFLFTINILEILSFMYDSEDFFFLVNEKPPLKERRKKNSLEFYHLS